MLKIIFRVLIAFIFLAILGLSAYVYFFQDQIIQAFVKEINKQINVEAEVNSIELNLWDHWPYSAIEFKDIKIRGNNCGIDERLLDAKELSFLANPLQLISGYYQIEKIHIQDGFIHIFRGKRCNNYDIFKESSEKEQSLNLSSVSLKNVFITYQSLPEDQYISALAKESKLNLKIDGSNFNISQNGSWLIDDIGLGIDHYLSKTDIEFSSDLEWYDKNKSLSIKNLKANMLNTDWDASAILKFDKEVDSEILVHTSSLYFTNIKSLLDAEFYKDLTDYEVKTEIEADLKLTGKLLESDFSALIDFKTNQVNFILDSGKYPISIKAVSGNWNIPLVKKWQNSVLKTEQFDGVFEERQFKMSLSLSNFWSPIIQTQLQTQQKFSVFKDVLNLPLDTGSKGEVSIMINYKGPFINNTLKNFNKSEISGQINIQNASFNVLQPNISIKNLFGEMDIKNNLISINSLNGNTKESDFNFKGSIFNLVPFLVGENEILSIKSALKSNSMNLEEWVTNEEGEDSYILTLPKNIQNELSLDIKSLRFNKFKASNVKGDLILKKQSLNLDSVKMNVAGGKIAVNMNINASNPNRIEWFTNGTMNNVYIDSAFYIFNNFNQNFIVQRHLQGQVNASFTGFLQSDEHLNFDDSKTIFSINTKIINGQLILFEPLQAVTKFIRETDLMNLQFADLENEIFIKDKIINIPKMEIKTNVRTIKIEGWHGFDNTLKYHLEIPITKEKIDKDQRFGKVEESKTGQTKVLLILEGNSTDYSVRYDNDAVKENIKTGIKEEVKELKDLFKKNKVKEEESVELDEDDFFDFN